MEPKTSPDIYLAKDTDITLCQDDYQVASKESIELPPQALLLDLPPDLQGENTPSDKCLSPEPMSEHSHTDSDLVSSEAEDEHRPLQTLPNNKGSRNSKVGRSDRPAPSGIILLGRGNSFSLGRSEVILLPQRRKKTPPATAGDSNNNNNQSNLSSQTDTASTLPPNSPPPLLKLSSTLEEGSNTNDNDCNQTSKLNHTSDFIAYSSEDLNEADVRVSTSSSNSAELEAAWARVEAVMARRAGDAATLLEEFGVGAEEAEGEAAVWQALTHHFLA